MSFIILIYRDPIVLNLIFKNIIINENGINVY
jgi:hypothetical protein